MLARPGEAYRLAISGGQDLTKGAHSKADAVYGELKEAILSGALEPGSLIDKTELCEKLQVSRFPVSAAVSRLAYDRLVDVAPQHGSFVARISLNDARERLFIRSALEGEIAAEAARRMSRADKDALAANLRQEAAAVAAKDRATFYALDVAFHQILTARLDMARAADVLEFAAHSSGKNTQTDYVLAGAASREPERAHRDRRCDRSRGARTRRATR